MDTILLETNQRWLEQNLWAAETLVTNGDNLTVRELVVLLDFGRFSGLLHLSVEVLSNECELLLDVTHNFALGGGGERVSALSQNLDHVVGQIATSEIQTHDSVRKSITLINRDSVGDTITRVEDNTGGTARGVQRKHGLDSDVHGWGVEGLKHNLSHLFTVSLWVERSLSQENWVLFWSNTQLVVESVVPDLLHIVPVGDDTVLNRVLEGKDTTLGLCLVSDVSVLLAHTDHDTLVTWTTHNRWEDGARSVITGETGLAHTGSVVDDQSLNFFFSHDELVGGN
mmetsp:Transcript_2413/g.4396  ORF Transcript_2413/g.4396 Transcript_2413/m.4396 type:complete len:284 (+) Transcript_2413:442-1293(+)